MTLEWDQPQHEKTLNEADTMRAFIKCKARVDKQLRFIGDGPIGGIVPNYFVSVYGIVVVEFTNQVPGVILYSEVSDILMALSWKMSREGYRACWVRVLRTGPLGEILGRVSVRDTV